MNFVSYSRYYDTLLQNGTDIITKCDSSFITKCCKNVFQNASDFLLQKATVLLQIATVIAKCVDIITKCDSHYKMRLYYKMHWYKRY